MEEGFGGWVNGREEGKGGNMVKVEERTGAKGRERERGRSVWAGV